MSINWGGYIRDVIDLGSESYEKRVGKLILQAGAFLIFGIVLWRWLK